MRSRAELKVVPDGAPSPSPAGGEASSVDLTGEVERLRRRIRQHEHTIAHLTEALLALRRGGQALREENRELRYDLRARRGT